MKTILFCLFSLGVLALGQEPKKLSRDAAAQAWASANTVPENTPSIANGALIVEKESSGMGRTVVLNITQPGTHLLVGKVYGGPDENLGEFYWEPGIYYSERFTTDFFDSASRTLKERFKPSIYKIEMVRIDRGQMQRVWVNIDPWNYDPPKFTATEGIREDGKYYIATTSLAPDAVVVLGREAMGKVTSLPGGGSIITFSDDSRLPPPGSTTLTVCSASKCETIAFERRLISPNSVPTGKG